MDSPMDPGSPESSISSRGTPPPDEQMSVTPQPFSPSTSGMSSFLSSKRRMQGGPCAGAAKARRTDGRRGAQWVEGPGAGAGKAARKDEDLVDVAFMEELREQLGDPFDERALKADN
ncbi:hypothetical protein GLOTRDRAFT_141197 [Gloeophyllum trabeum ATCC 11539]|uniref:Uncharacterized protein n=1 Tax=Gloeophyllum trabeum (strain ATCC 11539 / FP-39264 / Madison 617) TaxID=670483 RepID=S7PTG8_GLOTA|nr:uncharacterized protein GLOTRDRAFT_141197 [Gloeophyllum trabeum ATCC 11539]EPQ51051.1 hypothetical protein GLOTRDRAFT_141197 [Gloeophyllum trabeum ATCC 11539]